MPAPAPAHTAEQCNQRAVFMKLMAAQFALVDEARPPSTADVPSVVASGA